MSQPLRLLAILVLLIAALLARPEAQSRRRPDFSGTWNLVTSSGAAMSYLSSPLRTQGTVTQNEATLTLSTVEVRLQRQADGRNAPVRETPSVSYRLDGTETRAVFTNADGGTRTERAQTRWVQNALVITIGTDSGRSQWEDMMILSLDGGDNLHVHMFQALKDAQLAMGSGLVVYKKSQP